MLEMADFDAIRHALSVARDRGFAEVTLEDGALEFRAVLGAEKAKPKTKAASAAAEEDGDSDAGPQLAEVIAHLVGYYRPASHPLAVGGKVAKGDVVAVIAQLGIANDVESKVDGEVVEVCVEENQPVMFGQVLARIKEQ
jgi:acetyl-CoA carboxylase biotin carboxyl carrier protein